jgi:hypothetical protein
LPQRFDDLIEQLFASELDRALARAWIARLDKDGRDSRAEALLHTHLQPLFENS